MSLDLNIVIVSKRNIKKSKLEILFFIDVTFDSIFIDLFQKSLYLICHMLVCFQIFSFIFECNSESIKQFLSFTKW